LFRVVAALRPFVPPFLKLGRAFDSDFFRAATREGDQMKTIIAAVILAAGACASASAAADAVREVGVGVALGEPIGGTAKFWFDDRFAADVGAGLSDGNAAFWGDALWHDWSLLPQPSGGRLGLYVGAGPQFRTGDDARFGIRALGGATFRPTGHQLELYAEAGPLFRLTQGGQVDAVGGVGLRVMLGGALSQTAK
jgi:opacity protein-like surface antigen